MTTSISSEALSNYTKDIWKIKVEKISKRTKENHDGQDVYRIDANWSDEHSKKEIRLIS